MGTKPLQLITKNAMYQRFGQTGSGDGFLYHLLINLPSTTLW